MIEIQVQIPDHLYHEAKRVAAEYEMSFAEVVRRGLEKSLAFSRRVYDARLALILRAHGVTDFATANVKDFQSFGFTRVWNPLSPV